MKCYEIQVLPFCPYLFKATNDLKIEISLGTLYLNVDHLDLLKDWFKLRSKIISTIFQLGGQTGGPGRGTGTSNFWSNKNKNKRTIKVCVSCS